MGKFIFVGAIPLCTVNGEKRETILIYFLFCNNSCYIIFFPLKDLSEHQFTLRTIELQLIPLVRSASKKTSLPTINHRTITCVKKLYQIMNPTQGENLHRTHWTSPVPLSNQLQELHMCSSKHQNTSLIFVSSPPSPDSEQAFRIGATHYLQHS